MCSGLEQKATETQLLPEYTLLHMLFFLLMHIWVIFLIIVKRQVWQVWLYGNNENLEMLVDSFEAVNIVTENANGRFAF